MSKQATLQASYNGRMDQPGIEQIQPLRVNNNPLYEIVGNPELKPSFANNINLSYSSYKAIGGHFFNVGTGYAFTTNAISNSIFTDDNGKTTAQAINIKNRVPASFFVQGDYRRPIGKTSVGITGNVSGFSNYSLANNLLSASKTMNYSLGPVASRFEEKFDFRFALQPFYSTTRVTVLQQTVKSNQWGVSGNFNSTVPVPGKLALTISADYEYNGPTEAFDNKLSRLILDVNIYKTFLKNKNLRITVYAKDLLDQNTGFIRNVNNNMMRQESFSTIRRYFLLALSWDFSKMSPSATKK